MTVKAGGTFIESLRNTLGDLAQIAAMPDADLEFIVKLQGVITQFIRQQAMATVGGPPTEAPPGGEAAGAPAEGGPSSPGLGPPPAPPGIAPGGGAGMAGMGTPNPDELRRVMAGAAGAEGAG